MSVPSCHDTVAWQRATAPRGLAAGAHRLPCLCVCGGGFQVGRARLGPTTRSASGPQSPSHLGRLHSAPVVFLLVLVDWQGPCSSDCDRGPGDQASRCQVSICVRVVNILLTKVIIVDEPTVKRQRKKLRFLVGGDSEFAYSWGGGGDELGSVIQSVVACILNVNQTTFLFVSSLNGSLM